MTESPFVRNGAVVRCASCQKKYRIKSSHVERVLTTGPRTLDEADSVLRTDSVDIDPDEIAPVSIDDDGNVVGLSGLSELMRQSDAKGAKAKIQARMHDPASSDDGRDGVGPPAVERIDDQPASTSAAQRRARLLAQRKRKRKNALVLTSLGCLLVVSGVVLFMVLNQEKNRDGVESNGTAADDTPPKPGNNNPSNPNGNNGNNPRPDPGTDNPPAVDPELFAGIGPPTRNPDPRYIVPVVRQRPDVMPADVPTVMIPSRLVAYEGWYIMQPPRGSANAGGDADVEVGELTALDLDADQTLLTGAVVNRSEKALLGGELHVMLLDSSAAVFAETYVPLVMIAPDGDQKISLPIATRHWRRARGVRMGTKVTSWGESLSPLPNVKVDPVGQGEHAALRVSAFHTGDTALRNVLVLIEAVDSDGVLAARFMIENEKVYVASQTWLDLVVATPVDADQNDLRWSAMIQPR